MELHMDAEDGDNTILDHLAAVTETISTMPKTYETDGQEDKALVFLHYFNSGSDWWITERDCEEDQLQAFGFVCLNGDREMAELGYIDIEELGRAGVELDLYWQVKPLSDVKRELGLPHQAARSYYLLTKREDAMTTIKVQGIFNLISISSQRRNC
jgi:hypothetical protein